MVARLSAVGLLLVALFLAVPASAWGPPAPPVFARDDVDDENWLVGYLDWTDSNGRILWTDAEAAAPSTPDKPPQFVSEALPRNLLLNVSRQLEVDIFLSMAPGRFVCFAVGIPDTPGINVELFVGTRLAGAAIDGHRVFGFPVYDMQFELCRFRLALEVRELKAGDVLTLKFSYQNSKTGAPRPPGTTRFGLDPLHRSRIALPFFAPDEAYWRTHDRPAPDAGPPVGALLPLGLTAIPPARRARRLSVALCLLSLSAFAGCTGRGGDAEPNSSDATVGVNKETDPAFTGKGLGGLVGLVRDKSFAALPNANVIIVGTSNFTKTGGDGRFTLRGITPGTYTLHIDKTNYNTVETWIDIVADRITTVEVVLPLTEKPIGDGRHPHDYWDKKTVKEVFNDTLGVCPSVVNSQNSACTGPDNFTIPPKDEPGHNVVLPGTNEIEVVLDWEPTVFPYSRLGLMVQPNFDPRLQNWTYYRFRGPGEPFHVQTTWEGTDDGHQLFSTIRFSIYVSALEGSGSGSAVNTRLADAPALQVAIKLHKGVVPLDGAHPDHWQGATERELYPPATQSAYQYEDPVAVVGAASGAWPGGCGAHPVRKQAVAGIHDWLYVFRFGPAPNLVPPNASKVKITVDANRATGTNGVAAFEWQLWYKPADRPLDPFYAGNPAYVLASAPTASADRKSYTWEIPVPDTQTDGHYSKKSGWEFGLTPDDATEACLEAHAHAASSEPLAVTWSGRVFRAPA